MSQLSRKLNGTAVGEPRSESETGKGYQQ